MKHIKLSLAAMLIFFLATDSFSQDNKATTASHTHPELEKKLEEIKDNQNKSKETYDLAQETYKLTKEYDRTMDNRERQFFWLIGSIISLFSAMGLGTFIYNSVMGSKAQKEIVDAKKELVANTIKNFDELKKEILDKHTLEINKIISTKEKTIFQMVSAKERDYYLRENAKIIVINHKDTPISDGFKKALSLFGKFDLKDNMKNFTKLSDALVNENIAEFKDADLVIIENQDLQMQWKIGNASPSNELIMEVSKAGSETPDDLNNEHQNQAIMINLINKICDQTALIYYGPGALQSTKADPDKQHLIAFANSPSTLYSNVMNLLKFKDILESEQEQA